MDDQQQSQLITPERRAQLRANDQKSRTLIGARLRRDLAEEVQRLADLEGISVYAWVKRLITQEIRHRDWPW